MTYLLQWRVSYCCCNIFHGYTKYIQPYFVPGCVVGFKQYTVQYTPLCVLPWRRRSGRGDNDLRRWWGSVEYITSRRKRTVQLGSLLGLYERSRLKNKSGRHPPHRWDCTVEGHSNVLSLCVLPCVAGVYH